jgi:PAS domain S-box-containing protein
MLVIVCLGLVVSAIAVAFLVGKRRSFAARAATDSRLRSITDLAHDAIVVMASHNGEIAGWNAAAERMFGYETNEVMGQAIWDMMPASFDRSYSRIFQQLATGELAIPDVPVELTCARRDRSEFAAELSLSAFEEANVSYLVAIFRDVSQRKRSEDELVAAKQFAESVLNAATEYSILATDADGVITVCNRGAERLLGFPASELIRREVITVVHDAAEIQARAIDLGIAPGPAVLFAGAADGAAGTSEWTYIRKDGVRLPALITVNQVPSVDGTPPGFIFIAHDLSEQRRTERRLAFANEAFRKAFEAAPSAVVLMRPDMTCLHANPAFCEATGYSAQELRGLPMQHVIVSTTAEESERIAERFEQLVKGSTPVQHDERTIRRVDGSHFIGAVGTSVIFDADGELALFVSHVEDITDRRRREAEEREVLARKTEAIDRLEELDRAKGRFVSTVSHELRTPLVSIVGYTEMLEDGFFGTLSTDQSGAIDIIGRSARRLEQLITDLMTLSKLENGVQEPLPSGLVDIAAAARNAAATLMPLFQQRSQKFVVSVDESCGFVAGVERQLEHVITNLLTNAHKFTPDHGSIELRTRHDDDSVLIEVQDTGLGIPEDEQALVFTRFFRSDREEIFDIQGTGLGLPIVKAIVEQHGGEVTLTSELGQGTTIQIRLPRVVAEREETPV